MHTYIHEQEEPTMTAKVAMGLPATKWLLITTKDKSEIAIFVPGDTSGEKLQVFADAFNNIMRPKT